MQQSYEKLGSYIASEQPRNIYATGVGAGVYAGGEEKRQLQTKLANNFIQSIKGKSGGEGGGKVFDCREGGGKIERFCFNTGFNKKQHANKGRLEKCLRKLKSIKDAFKDLFGKINLSSSKNSVGNMAITSHNPSNGFSPGMKKKQHFHKHTRKVDNVSGCVRVAGCKAEFFILVGYFGGLFGLSFWFTLLKFFTMNSTAAM